MQYSSCYILVQIFATGVSRSFWIESFIKFFIHAFHIKIPTLKQVVLHALGPVMLWNALTRIHLKISRVTHFFILIKLVYAPAIWHQKYMLIYFLKCIRLCAAGPLALGRGAAFPPLDPPLSPTTISSWAENCRAPIATKLLHLQGCKFEYTKAQIFQYCYQWCWQTIGWLVRLSSRGRYSHRFVFLYLCYFTDAPTNFVQFMID